MKTIVCPRHGSIMGNLACPEISTAAQTNSPVPSHKRITVDCATEASPGTMLTFLACHACINEFHLEEATQVPWGVFCDASAMPSLVPVCPICLGMEDLNLVGVGPEG